MRFALLWLAAGCEWLRAYKQEKETGGGGRAKLYTLAGEET